MFGAEHNVRVLGHKCGEDNRELDRSVAVQIERLHGDVIQAFYGEACLFPDFADRGGFRGFARLDMTVYRLQLPGQRVPSRRWSSRTCQDGRTT